MLAKQCLLVVGALALQTASALVFDADWPLNILRRQDMSTAEYNCHDNCGQAILAARAATNPCANAAFTHDYAACLQCAGADNADIWQYYGAQLTAAAARCSLSTAPLSGTQAAVSAAITASTAAATGASNGTASATTGASAGSASGSAAASTGSAASSGAASSASASAAASASASASSSAANAAGGAAAALGWSAATLGSLAVFGLMVGL